jgi:hypothetical protein
MFGPPFVLSGFDDDPEAAVQLAKCELGLAV